MRAAGTSGVQPSECTICASEQCSLHSQPELVQEKFGGAELRPVNKVKVRIGKKIRATALDKQYRHVAALQFRNRQRTAQKQREQEQQQARQQQLSGFSQQLRATILAGDYEALQETWKPAATAAHVKYMQQTAALQARLSMGSSSVARVYDPSAPKVSTHELKAPPAPDSVLDTLSISETAARGPQSNTEAASASDDIDTFLDGLLQQATAQKAASKDKKPVAASAETAAEAQTLCAIQQKEAESAQKEAVAGAAVRTSISRPGTAKPTSKQRPPQKPAWAVSEQQQAETEAAAEAAEEAELLEFAEQLDWQELIGKLDDDQLAAAFKELEVADAAAAAGDSSADKQWRASFVTALNHAALQNVAAAVGGGNSSPAEGDRYSEVPSTASQIRRAEEKAGRRQRLLDRLSRLQGSSGASVLDNTVKGSTAAPGSTAGDRASLFSGSAGFGCVRSGAAGDDWDRSTRCGGDDVQAVQQQLKVLEASEVLAENPEMRGVHSVASIKSLLQKKDVQ